MSGSRVFVVALVVLMAGCSKSPSPPSPAAAPAPAAGAAQAAPRSACDLKLVAAADVADLFDAPVTTTKNIAGDAQTCEFSTSGFSSVTIALRPGHGKASVGGYTSGHMNEFEKSEPLPGVGDEAVRSLGLNRVIARKGDLLCEITGPGLAPPAGDPMIAKLGKLCNKIFAAYAP